MQRLEEIYIAIREAPRQIHAQGIYLAKSGSRLCYRNRGIYANRGRANRSTKSSQKNYDGSCKAIHCPEACKVYLYQNGRITLCRAGAFETTLLSGAGGSRTHTLLRAEDFKSTASAIPPPPRHLSGTTNGHPEKMPDGNGVRERRRSESNRRIRLLQSPALPLGYVAKSGLRDSNP
jgi:hypothetical protein